MNPILFELSRTVIIVVTCIIFAVSFFLQRKEPPRLKIFTVGIFIIALIMEVIFINEPIKVPAYGFMMMIAFITGTYLAAFRAKKWGINPNHLIDGGLLALIFGILGARALFIIQFFDEFFWGTGYTPEGKPYNKFWNIFKVWQGGMVFYGGLIGAGIALIIFIKKKKLDVSILADLILPSVILGLAITRIGCFLNGCCFGYVTDVPWGVTFPKRSFAHEHQLRDAKEFITSHKDIIDPGLYKSRMRIIRYITEEGKNKKSILNAAGPLNDLRRNLLANGVSLEDKSKHIRMIMRSDLRKLPLPVHATELYHSFMGFLIFGILIFLTKWRTFNGQIAVLFGIFYPVNRFIIEFWRGDNERTFGLTISQWISLVLVAVCIPLYVILRKKGTCTKLPLENDNTDP